MDCQLYLLNPQLFPITHIHESVSELQSIPQNYFPLPMKLLYYLNNAVLQHILILEKGGHPHCFFLFKLF